MNLKNTSFYTNINLDKNHYINNSYKNHYTNRLAQCMYTHNYYKKISTFYEKKNNYIKKFSHHTIIKKKFSC